MKKLGIVLSIMIVGIFAVFGWVLYTASPCNNFTRDVVWNGGIQALGALATVAAVLYSLFGDRIQKKLNKPNLRMCCKRDKAHCYIQPELEGGLATSSQLEILLSVHNDSETPARSCQLVSNCVYVSQEGDFFVKYDRFCTASYKWMYKDKADSAYGVDIRKSIEKYAKILEIIQCPNEGGSTTADESTVIKPETYFSLCLPVHGGSDPRISIPSDYKGVLIPIKLVCNDVPTQIKYLKVIWKGRLVTQYKSGGLHVGLLSEKEAMKVIDVSEDF